MNGSSAPAEPGRRDKIVKYDDFDYVIVGAGSAGCVLANRLSQDPANRVLLLEAGTKDRSPWLHLPIGYFKAMHNPKFDWCYEIEPDPGLNGRTIEWPRGKVLGGSSALNGLLYVRGQAQDYDHWQALGNPGWSYQDVLPYFLKSESNERGADAFHGADGELAVSDIRVHRRVCDLFIASARACGLPLNHDFNADTQEGVGYFQLNITQQGRRSSSSQAFLKPILRRKNLSIETEAHAHRIVFENSAADGVVFEKSGVLHQTRARREVIIAAGAIGSPQLLMLSGIGEPQQLRQHHIPVLKPSPGVGQNLQDHLQIRSVYKIKQPLSLNDELRSPFRRLGMGLEYLFRRWGPLTMAASQVAAFTSTKQDEVRPDIQFHFQPLSSDKPAAGTHPFSAFTASVCQLRPSSRGEITLRSSNSYDHPEIHANYLDTELDQLTAIAGVKKTREICSNEPIASLIEEEFEPGVETQSDPEILEFARARGTTIYHPVGTCKMGPASDPMNVVDHRLRVHGLERLRVVDSSIMPTLTSGNTNAPTIMIGEKAAEMILQDQT